MPRRSANVARRMTVCLTLAAALTSNALAQDPDLLVPERIVRNATYGAEQNDRFLIGIPVGEFGAHVSVSPGIGVSGVIQHSDRAVVGVRLDGYYLAYGIDTRRMSPELVAALVDVPPPGGALDVTTENRIHALLAGPQIGVRGRDAGAYLSVGAGLSRFATISSVTMADPLSEDGEVTLSTTNFEHYVLAWAGSAGLDIRLANNISLAIDAQYLHNGRTRYVDEGSLRIDQTGASFTPTESAANLVVLQIGISFSTGDSRPKPRRPLTAASKQTNAATSDHH